MEISEIFLTVGLVPAIFNHDQQHAMGSLEKLAPFEASVAVPGHGEPPYGSPGQAVELAPTNP